MEGEIKQRNIDSDYASNAQPPESTPSDHYQESYDNYMEIQALKKAAQEAEKDRITDSLTGLYNRRYLDDFVKKFDQSRSKKSTAVIFCDADNLGAINKTFGDAAGDELLLSVTKALQKSVREEDTIIRKGGDEFLIFIQNFSNFDELKNHVSQRLKLNQNSNEKDEKFPKRFSFGIVQYDPNEDKSLIDTVQRANDEMRIQNPNKKQPKH